jgi:hypothetical protein
MEYLLPSATFNLDCTILWWGVAEVWDHCMRYPCMPTRQGDAFLIPGLPLAVLVQGTAPTAGLLVTVVHGVIFGANLIPGNGDLEHSGQNALSYIHRQDLWKGPIGY